MGLLEDVNLFVNDEGHWDPLSYVPTYLRCHPFTLAKEAGGQLAIVVDRDAASVSEEPEFPFFTNGEPSEHTQALMQLCAEYRARTPANGHLLSEVGRPGLARNYARGASA